MDAYEPPWIQLLFELGEREIDDVIAAVGHAKRELVPGKKVRHPRDVEKRCPLADARRDACERSGRRRAKVRGELAGQCPNVGPRRRTAFELVDGAIEPLRLDRFEQVID